ncbi:MAG: formylglycine-generating enzyme family protein, partial [Chitinophagaceae bacterium]
MVLVPAGEFLMGSSDEQARPDENPQHKVKVNAFWMDATEVTNAQFRKFVEATGYVTTAEQKPDWEELKKQLPPNTPKPEDDVLVPASLVFHPDEHHASPGEWWQWTKGASWKHPQGEGSGIDGKDDYPVTHISWYDANAYAKWAGKRLPTEAEWEWAARAPGDSKTNANIWQGEFPHHNSMEDKFERTAPVKSFHPNTYGLFDMAGNVWEWCSDWYDAGYYNKLKEQVSDNPEGPKQSYDPEEPTVQKKVIRGGSFMCHDSYCSGYRPSARMKVSPDTGLE